MTEDLTRAEAHAALRDAAFGLVTVTYSETSTSHAPEHVNKVWEVMVWREEGSINRMYLTLRQAVEEVVKEGR